MIWSVVRPWLIRLAMAATGAGGLGFLLFNRGGPMSERDLAATLGFGEYTGVIEVTSVMLFIAGLIVLTILDPEEDT